MSLTKKEVAELSTGCYWSLPVCGWDSDGPYPTRKVILLSKHWWHDDMLLHYLVYLAHRPLAKGTILNWTHTQPCSISVSNHTPTIASYAKIPAGISASIYIFNKPQLEYLETLVTPFKEQHRKWDPKFVGNSKDLSEWIQKTADETKRMDWGSNVNFKLMSTSLGVAEVKFLT